VIGNSTASTRKTAGVEVATGNLTLFLYSHYSATDMRKVPSGIAPIISLDRNAPQTLQKQIYDGYRSAIVERRLRSGQRVASSRVLAGELGVSRIPVLNAYAQLLAEGYFESRVGSGTVVARSLPDQFGFPRERKQRITRPEPKARNTSRRFNGLPKVALEPWSRQKGAFGVGQIAFDAFPFALWSRLTVRHARRVGPTSLHYGDAMGSRELREAISSYLAVARGVRCDPSQVMIVSGSQHALELSARVILDRGSKVWMEEPGYPLARHVFALAGCRLIPVPVDRQGLDVAAGMRDCREARAAFVTPSHQYPLGVTMTASRRFELLNWAQEAGSWIIEDDYDSEYRYESKPVASLQGLDSNFRVIYVGTFSKVLFPSLRLGYVVIPPDLIAEFLTVRRSFDLGSPTFLQSVLADFIREGHFSRHIRRMRTLYSERRNVLVASLQEEFGSSVDVLGSEAGMHLVVTFKGKINDKRLSEQAASQRLWLWPLSPCYLGQGARAGFILGFASTPAEEIPASVRRLKKLLRVN